MTEGLVGDRYRLGALLGAGGSASVFRAEDTLLCRPVAVKLLHPHLAQRTDAVDRFVAEARVGAGLDHPNLVRVLDAGQDGQLVWLVQELVEGVTLADLVAASGPMAEADAFAVVAGVLAGLSHAHVRGILHLDLSASNVMVPQSPQGLELTRVRVLDLGGRPIDRSAVPLVRVSPCYASPEVATAAAVGPEADLYSVGALLLLLVTGRPPFDGPDPGEVLEAQVNDRPPTPSSRVPGLSSEVDRIVARCLAKLPAERYPTATAMAVDVARARGALVARRGAPGSTRELTPAAPAGPGGRALMPRHDASTGPGSRAPGRIGASMVLLVTGALVAVAVAVAQPGSAQGAAPAAWSDATTSSPSPSPSASPTAIPAASPTGAPEPTSAPIPALLVDVPMPDLAGLTLAAAQEVLQAAGLAVGPTTYQDGPSVAGVVLASTPVPGGAVVTGAPVALVVASGASTVPGVTGLTPTQARSALESAGLVVAPLEAGGEDVRIVSTVPAAGRRVLVGETVVLIAGSPEPTPAPTEPAPPASPEPTPSRAPEPTPSRAPVPTTDPNG
ncbi:protein kinase [Cellulomonas sp. KRMCY2]|uniref:protein kinase domain-containing protein n=1 Tax=Cellulomonas sp. KRMCY2 TaxID=1304865 RepID=UPI00045E6094|nr:protein kinase [Cellulomonas sp. KRMCY2]